MTTFLTKAHRQTATYWELTGVDGFGDDIFATPVAINVRWEEHTERMLEINGEQIMSKASVWTGIDLVKGSYLSLGSLLTLNDPKEVGSAYIIHGFEKIPGISGTRFERKAYL